MSCAARARALVPAHSCQRADNVLFLPAVTSPPFSHPSATATAPHRRRFHAPPLPVAATPRRPQGPPPPPSPPLSLATKVRLPPRRRLSPSPPRSAALPVATKVRRPPRRRSSPSESPPRSAAPDLPGLSPTPWPENDPSIPQASGRRVSPASRRVNRVSQHEPPPVLPAKAARRFAPLVHAMLAPK